MTEVMAEAGLTHGGFYAHFPSKDDLVVAAVEEAFRGRARRSRGSRRSDPGAGLDAFVDFYVSTEHRGNRRRGCPIAALSSDLPRQGLPVREAYGPAYAG